MNRLGVGDEPRVLRRWATETGCITADDLPWIVIRNHPRMTETRTTPRNALDEIAASVKRLTLYLDNIEIEGRALTAGELAVIANQLQVHAADLLAATKRLRDAKPDR
jgi:hypothetical protein